MERHSGLALKEAGQMKWRCVDGPGDILQGNTLTELAREISLGCLGSVCVIGVCRSSAGLARPALSRERGFQHIGNELQRGYIRPKWFEWFQFSSLKPLHELAVPPENT